MVPAVHHRRRQWLGTVAAVAVLALPGRPIAEGPPRRVLIIHADATLLPGAVLADHGLRSRLAQAPIDVAYDTEHIDVSLDSAQNASVRDFLRRKHAGRTFDVVFTVGLRALRFAVESRAELFPATPIVFSAVVGGDAPLALPADLSGVVLGTSASDTLRAAARLQTRVRRVVVLGGASQLDRLYLGDVRRELERDPVGLQVSYLDGLPVEAARDQLARLTPDAVVLFVSMLRDGAGRVMTSPEAVRQLRPYTAVPIYGLADTLIGHGVVGGRLISFEGEAARAADLVLERLQAPASSPGRIEPSRNAFVFDGSELRHWGISERDLPVGSTVVNRPPTLWDLYRWQIAGIGSVVVVQGALIAGLLVQRARRRRAEAAIRARESSLRESQAEIRELADRLIDAQEDERRRIARELHDDVNQRLASMSIDMSALKRRVAAIPGAADTLTALQQETIRLTHDLRQLSHDLHPALLEQAGLVEALRARVRELSAESGIVADVRVEGEWVELPQDVALCLYRVAQEALRNVVQHAQASTASIRLTHAGTNVEMLVSDNGRGFDDAGPGGRPGLGLASMRERVRMLGGTLALRTAPATGTDLRVSLPVGGRA